MGIQFTCNGCSSTLKVNDEFAGKQARCPKCKMVLVVPGVSDGTEASSAAVAGEFLTPDQPTTDWNPYAAPTASKPTPLPQKVGGGTGRPTAVDPGRVIGHAFEVWKENLGVLIGATVFLMLVSFVISFAAEFCGGFIAAVANDELAGKLFILVADNFIGTLINWFLAIGITKISLSAARGGKPEFGMLFSGANVFLAYVISSILFGLGMFVGFLLLVVPGIIFVLHFWPYSMFVVDGKATAISSFGEAIEIAKINKGTAFVLFLASLGISLVGLMAFCVGIIAAAPLVSCIYVTAYLMMKGEIR